LKKADKISGVILAGGAGKRFGGKTKSRMAVGGIPIMTRMVKILDEIFNEIIIVTNTPEEFREYVNVKLVKDKHIKVGPLGGIHAAMSIATNPYLFVFAGDMPFVSKDLILEMISCFEKSDCDVLIPRLEKYNEPLHAIYSLSAFIKLETYLLTRKDYAIRDFLSGLNVKYMDLENTDSNRKIFTNINSPSDLLAAEDILLQYNLNISQ
jgi:molybdopterin-guanine dinucleotide biosynthesis protein A